MVLSSFGSVGPRGEIPKQGKKSTWLCIYVAGTQKRGRNESGYNPWNPEEGEEIKMAMFPNTPRHQ